MFNKWVDQIQNMIAGQVPAIPYVPYYADVFINKLYEVVVLLRCTFVGERRRNVAVFNKRRYRRLRQRFKAKQKSVLPAIKENSVQERIADLEVQNQDLQLSCSDHVLNCLANGWTVKEAFGLKRGPKAVPLGKNLYLMERIFMKHGRRRKTLRRKLNFKDLITDFLTDQVVFRDSRCLVNKDKLC